MLRKREGTRRAREDNSLSHQQPESFSLFSIERTMLRVKESDVVKRSRDEDRSVEEGKAELSESLGDERGGGGTIQRGGKDLR